MKHKKNKCKSNKINLEIKDEIRDILNNDLKK